jgi:hypothetical protein
MSKKIGIQLNSDGELAIVNGHLSVGNTLYQNQYIILKAHKGELKENPMMGAGIDDMANDDDVLGWKRTIREELARDGMKVSELTISGDELNIKADYDS